MFSGQWLEPLAQVLKNLGSERVWVVHGSDGLDEITTSGPTNVAALENGVVRTFEITPEDVGLRRAKPEALRGGDADDNAAALHGRAGGQAAPFPRRRLAQCRGGAGRRRQGEDLTDGVDARRQSVDSGGAEGRLDRAGRGLEPKREWLTSLTKIEAYKREEIAAAKRARPLAALERAPKPPPPPRGFLAAIARRHRRRRPLR